MTTFKPYTYNFWDDPFLSSAGLEFGGVFIAFHPFQRLTPSCDSLVWWPGEEFFDKTATDPAMRDAWSYEKAFGTDVLWADVASAAGMTGPAEIAIAYLTHYKKLKPEWLAPASLQKLKTWCEYSNTYLPEWDNLPPTFEMRLAKIFGALGMDHYVGGHVWNGRWAAYPVTDLAEPRKSIRGATDFADSNCLFSPNHQVVFTTIIDDMFSIIAIKPEAMAIVDLADFFEGFWANDVTSPMWIHEPLEHCGPVSRPKWMVRHGKLVYQPRS